MSEEQKDPTAPEVPLDDATGALSAPPPKLEDNKGLERGTKLGRYVVLERLGAGGMGVVYAAYDLELRRRVALKLLTTGAGTLGSSSGSQGEERLLREARAVAQLTHPNVVTIYDVGAHERTVFIALELVEGSTLTDWLRASPRTWREVVKVFIAAGRGLAAAHAAGLVHRDFKPANVLMGNDGRIRVTDFGIARKSAAPELRPKAPEAAPGLPLAELSEEGEEPLTQAGSVLGTPGYIPPEMYAGKPSDARGDQFSFCVALYAGLYRMPPFAGKGVLLIRNISLGEVQPPPPGTKVPAWLRRIVLKGLSVKPEDRYPSMEALLTALGRDVSAQRRKAALVGLGALGVLGVLAGLRSASTREARTCRGGAEKVQMAWSPARQKALEGAFLATGKPFAGSVWHGFQGLMDARFADWAKMRVEACEATRVRQEQPEDAMALRMECLDDRFAELEGLVKLYEHPDATMVEKAVTAASSVSSLNRCADLTALRSPIPIPEGAGLKEQVRKLRTDLNGLKPLAFAGRYKDAHEALTRLMPSVDATRYGPLRAEALELDGELQLGLQNGREADRALTEAARAADSGKMDDLRARALVELAFGQGIWEARYDDAAGTGKNAEAVIDRLALARQDELRSLLDHTLATMQHTQGRYAEAEAHALRAVSVRERGSNPVDLATSLNVLALIYSFEAQYAKATPLFARVRDIWLKQLGPDHPMLSKVDSAEGNLDLLSGDFEGAIRHFQRSRDLLSRVLPGSAGLGVAQNNLGNADMLLEHYELALQEGQAARAIFEKALGTDHYYTACAMETSGIALIGLGKVKEGIEDCQGAVERWEKKFGPRHAWVAEGLSCTAEGKLQLGQLMAARADAERSLALFAEHTDESPFTVALVRFTLAQILTAQKADNARAVALARQARASFAASSQLHARVAQIDAWLEKHGGPAAASAAVDPSEARRQ